MPCPRVRPPRARHVPRRAGRARTPSSCCSPSSSPGSRRRRPPSGRGPASGSASGYGALHLADRPVRFPRRAGSPAVLVYGSALLVAAGGFVLLFLCDAGDGHGAAGLGTCAKSRNGDAVGPDMGAAGWGLQAGASRTVPVTLFRQFQLLPFSVPSPITAHLKSPSRAPAPPGARS